MAKDALAKQLSQFKADERSTVSAAGVLTKIINDYCREDLFSDYLEKHRMEAGNYLPDSQHRSTRWRASSAGKCAQQQAYTTLFKLVAFDTQTISPTNPSTVVEEETGVSDFIKAIVEPPRSPNTWRALYNGTFNHIRYHMMFDHLNELGRVRTIGAEEFRTDPVLSLSGTIDRRVAFTWEDQVVRTIVDFKTMRSDKFKELGYALPEHQQQVTAYFVLKFECDWGMVLYENKDSHEINIQDVPWSDIAIQALKDQYRMMNKWVDQMLAGVTRKDRVKLPIITDWCRTCPFNTICQVEHPERMAAIREGLPEAGVF